MARIAYILLCHKDPEGIIAQAQRLTAAGDFIAIHFDARAKPADHDRIRLALATNPAVTFAAKRIKCGWGEWSLVEASLQAARAAVEAFPRATHFYMLSGDCMPIKTAEYAHAFLDREDVDYIESVDFFGSDWLKTGIKDERLIFRHWFNERTHKWLFYQSMNLKSAGFADTTFRLLSTSPLIDAGYNDSPGINYDFYYHQRPYGKGVDIGMSEYNPKYPPQAPAKNISDGDDSLMSLGKKSKLRIEQMPFPAPVVSRLVLVYSNDSTFDVSLDTYNLQGEQLSHNLLEKVSPGIHNLDLDVKSYPDGICLFTLRGGKEAISGKFIKSK